MRELAVAGEHFYRYSCAESRVGRILVLMTDEGVVDVVGGDTLKGMVSSALARHPGAVLIPDCGAHDQWVAAIIKRFERPGSDWTVPFELGEGHARRAAG